MAFKQPKVPQAREDPRDTARELTLFLRDFCMASWNADRRRDAEMARLERRVEALERSKGEGG